MTIAELNNFVITAPSQEIDFLCTGRVSSVDTDKGLVLCCMLIWKTRLTLSKLESHRITSPSIISHLPCLASSMRLSVFQPLTLTIMYVMAMMMTISQSQARRRKDCIRQWRL